MNLSLRDLRTYKDNSVFTTISSLFFYLSIQEWSNLNGNFDLLTCPLRINSSSDAQLFCQRV